MQTNKPARLFRLFPSSQVLLPHRITQRTRERKAQGGGRFKGRYLFNKSLHYSHTDADSKRAKPTTHRQATPTPREFRRGPRRHMTPLRLSINSLRRRGLEDFVVRRTLRGANYADSFHPRVRCLEWVAGYRQCWGSTLLLFSLQILHTQRNHRGAASAPVEIQTQYDRPAVGGALSVSGLSTLEDQRSTENRQCRQHRRQCYVDAHQSHTSPCFVILLSRPVSVIPRQSHAGLPSSGTVPLVFFFPAVN